MPLDAATFEKLGAFYLGGLVDPATQETTDTPFLYDSRDLVTHAVCVGMTGSGKTGLCIGLLEEAAIDGIPALVIDPKGDLANLALQFPLLRGADFQPWISPDEAARAGQDGTAFAESQAGLWRDGLAKWGQDGARIARLQSAAEVAVYTPGSTAGIPVSVLSSFDAPANPDDAEGLADRVDSTAAALLGLAGVTGDALTSREHTLLATILSHAWSAGESLTLAGIVQRVQKPPFPTIGVLDLEAFYPEKERFKLVLALNNLLASPAFAAWQQGVPLDVQSLLFTDAGRPRIAVLSIAHLDDSQRMFFVSLLLNAAVSWMRTQPGTTSLRALLYMDEVFGYFPPVANPPSKKPLLTLLKQARAFGLGVVLATQNPADLDYKGLSNAGTWFIGRLQTERDRARLLDGLGNAGAADRVALEKLLALTGRRRFVMQSAHGDEPVLFETRWTLSYLRGPLTRDQIRNLQPASAAPQPAAAPQAVASSPAAPVVTGIPQVFAKTGGERWTPRLLVIASLRYRDARRGIDSSEEEGLLVTLPAGPLGRIDWAAAGEARIDDFSEVVPGGSFENLPEGASDAKRCGAWAREAEEWLIANRPLTLLRCKPLGLESSPGESERDFRVRVTLAQREARDARADVVRARYAKKLEALQARVARASEALTREQAQAGQARVQTMVSIGSTILGALLGRKAISASNVGRATTAARGMGRSMKEQGDVAKAREKLDALEVERSALEAELAAELAGTAMETADVETIRLPPVRGGVKARLTVLAWIPA